MSTLTISHTNEDGTVSSRSMEINCGSLSRTTVLQFVGSFQNRVCKKLRVVASKGQVGLSPTINSSALRPIVFPPLYIVGKIPTKKGARSASVLSPQAVKVPGFSITQSRDAGPNTVALFYGDYRWDNRRDGVTLPNWRAVVRAGGNATTAMTATRASISFVPGYISMSWKDPSPFIHKTVQSDAVFGNFEFPALTKHVVSGLLLKECDNGALAKLYDKLYKLEHDADIGESLGEYKQTLSMIGAPLQGIHDLIGIYRRRADEVVRDRQRRVGRTLSRFDARDVKDVNAAIGKLWLELRFGLLPLMSDIESLIKAAESQRNKIGTKVNASYKSSELVSDVTRPNNIIVNYMYYVAHEIRKTVFTVKYQCGVNVTKVQALSYLQRIGLIPSRFVPTLYAITPYSWFLDYFTGLNNVLDALFADFQFVTWTSRTTRQESICELYTVPNRAKAENLLKDTLKSYASASGSATLVRTDVTRGIPSSLVPPVKLALPKSWKPYANTVALLLSKKLPGLVRLGSVALPNHQTTLI